MLIFWFMLSKFMKIIFMTYHSLEVFQPRFQHAQHCLDLWLFLKSWYFYDEICRHLCVCVGGGGMPKCVGIWGGVKLGLWLSPCSRQKSENHPGDTPFTKISNLSLNSLSFFLISILAVIYQIHHSPGNQIIISIKLAGARNLFRSFSKSKYLFITFLISALQIVINFHARKYSNCPNN